MNRKGNIEYYFISPMGEINSMTDADTSLDRRLKKFGNYFKTRAKAKEAVEKIKEVLNEYGRNKENS